MASNLLFSPFVSSIEPSFWHKAAQLKLDTDMLQEVPRNIWGYYSSPDVQPFSLSVDYSAFNTDPENESTRRNVACGIYLNKNTIESFKACDKKELLQSHGDTLLKNIHSGAVLEKPFLLSSFVVLTYADLKKFNFYYWFTFPSPASPAYKSIEKPENLSEIFSDIQLRSLVKNHSALPRDHRGFFGVKVFDADNVEVVTLKQYIELKKSNDDSKSYLGFTDPSSYPDSPGWPLRNLLAVINYDCPVLLKEGVEVIAMRGISVQSVVNSLIFKIKLQDSPPSSDHNANNFFGWEKNNRGKYGPKFVDLSGIMDPTKLAERAVSLNLKLMKWRLLPSLDLEILKSVRCLLLGAGTLGCAVARNLMAWGIHRITFVDSGRVSYSNPVRQSLYLHKHCTDKGELKAKAAANTLKEIYPGSESEGVELSIPMPNHSTSDLESAEALDSLISSHDVVFLLTDSRESRWLPTLLAAVKRKIAITSALGFDSYLVLRHGLPLESDGDSGPKLGCYFCNDITAPGNSQTDRTLDQQCTVTRPGVSSIAASLAVELFVSLLQHPLKGSADSKDECCLGFVPHSIRGFLAQFQQMMPSTPAFSQCIACSPVVMQEYQKRGGEFLQEVFKNSKYLEELTGLTQLHSKTEEADIWEYSDEETAGDSS